MNWRSDSVEALRSKLERLVLRIEPRLPTLEDYSLPGDRKAALKEVKQLLTSALDPNDHGERAELLYLKTRSPECFGHFSLCLRYLYDCKHLFDLPVREIRNLLQSLNHDLVGTWQADFGNDILHFDQDSGTVTAYGKVLHFRWREIDGSAIAIAPLAESAGRLQPGLYYFKINTQKGSSFELIFLDGFGGTSLRRFERSCTSAKTAMDPARVAMRLAASKPLPDLGPQPPVGKIGMCAPDGRTSR